MSEIIEADPFGLGASTPGAKLDAGKEPTSRGLFEYFPRALLEVARVSGFGAAKYSWGGWKHVPDGVSRYEDATGRHILKKKTEGTFDSDGQRHQAQVAWNALAVLELELIEEEKAVTPT